MLTHHGEKGVKEALSRTILVRLLISQRVINYNNDNTREISTRNLSMYQ